MLTCKSLWADYLNGAPIVLPCQRVRGHRGDCRYTLTLTWMAKRERGK